MQIPEVLQRSFPGLPKCISNFGKTNDTQTNNLLQPNRNSITIIHIHTQACQSSTISILCPHWPVKYHKRPCDQHEPVVFITLAFSLARLDHTQHLLLLYHKISDILRQWTHVNTIFQQEYKKHFKQQSSRSEQYFSPAPKKVVKPPLAGLHTLQQGLQEQQPNIDIFELPELRNKHPCSPIRPSHFWENLKWSKV